MIIENTYNTYNNNYYNSKNINNILINYYKNGIIGNDNNILNNIIIEEKLEKEKQNENKIRDYENQ